ncbi:MAG: tyrosine-type recombinase/integrase [Oscillospiraceae bacterium]|jgi:integrase|nr:tyrosine-type recombinase/integrase [Oscillospiraceae bacterium]
MSGRCINYDPDPQGHVCTNKNGKLFSPDYVSHGFGSLLKRHGLPYIRFHELRHTAGSLLLNNGMSVKQIAEYLGHEKVSTTLDIYAHIDFEGKRATPQAMGNIFKNS